LRRHEFTLGLVSLRIQLRGSKRRQNAVFQRLRRVEQLAQDRLERPAADGRSGASEVQRGANLPSVLEGRCVPEHGPVTVFVRGQREGRWTPALSARVRSRELRFSARSFERG